MVTKETRRPVNTQQDPRNSSGIMTIESTGDLGIRIDLGTSGENSPDSLLREPGATLTVTECIHHLVRFNSQGSGNIF